MQDIRLFIKFLWLCIKKASARSIGISDAINGGVGGSIVTLVTGWVGIKIPIPNTYPYADQAKAIIYFVAILAMIWIIRFIFSPYFLWKEAQIIDRVDLENLLNGTFLGDTFFYKSEIVCCTPWEYKSKYELEKLRDTWTSVSVPAPKNSLAEIHFQFSNGHPKGQRDFYVRDPNGDCLRIDIYSNNYIILDSNSRFYFKLTYSDDYEISEHSSLRIQIRSWKK